jgi:hypothetical protein
MTLAVFCQNIEYSGSSSERFLRHKYAGSDSVFYFAIYSLQTLLLLGPATGAAQIVDAIPVVTWSSVEPLIATLYSLTLLIYSSYPPFTKF